MGDSPVDSACEGETRDAGCFRETLILPFCMPEGAGRAAYVLLYERVVESRKDALRRKSHL